MGYWGVALWYKVKTKRCVLASLVKWCLMLSGFQRKLYRTGEKQHIDRYSTVQVLPVRSLSSRTLRNTTAGIATYTANHPGVAASEYESAGYRYAARSCLTAQERQGHRASVQNIQICSNSGILQNRIRELKLPFHTSQSKVVEQRSGSRIASGALSENYWIAEALGIFKFIVFCDQTGNCRGVGTILQCNKNLIKHLNKLTHLQRDGRYYVMQVIARVTSHPTSCCRSKVQYKVPAELLTLSHPPPPVHTHSHACVLFTKVTPWFSGWLASFYKKKNGEKTQTNAEF